eukprot:Nitzschia sp. Nitz4//scaffold5_size260463//178900//179589//NITZ4_001002-RA/size260463-processed-gene-0.88-mRNA-1//1//CDS//3329555400//540//frame0
MASIFLGAIAISATGSALYKLGLLDWPTFEERIIEPEIYVFLACVRSKDISGSVMRLLDETQKTLRIVVSKEKLVNPALAYGAPADCTNGLSVGVYIDNPQAVEAPRWGIGWAVQVDNEEELKSIEAKIAEEKSLTEPIRVVKLGGNQKVLAASIPWRLSLTPAIAPMLHWPRAFKAYNKAGYKTPEEVDTVAIEVYVTADKCERKYIDYVVPIGEGVHTKIAEAMFPN